MTFSLKISKNIKSMTRRSKYSYISIFTNFLWTDNETKIVKPIYKHHTNLIKIRRTKSRICRSPKERCDRNFSR